MELTRSLALRALEWCKKKYGLSKYKDAYPALVFREKYQPKDKPNLMGEYYWEKNKIFIYKKSHLDFEDPVLELIFTMIHEYKHYLQNMDNYNTYFDKYYYTYKTHPYERTCNRFADREMYECYYHVVIRDQKKSKKGGPPLDSQRKVT
jgi:Zn-dependent peptidase ImmA (M78 family)